MKKSIFLYPANLCIIVLLISMVPSLTGCGNKEPDPASSPGTIRQWASSAFASTQYAKIDWSTAQVIGAPDTPGCGYSPTAWASAYYNGVDFVDVGFDTPVVPSQINIYETYNPGSIVKVELRDEAGSFHTIYEASPTPVETCPRTLTLDINFIDFKVTSIVISLDQSVLKNWNQIDAVEMVGRP